MNLFDSHCHLDAEEFDHDRAQVIARAQAAGVRSQVLPAVTAASWPKLRDTARLASGLYPAYGLHPMFLDQHHPEHLDQLREWIVRERPCAVGECGLDFFVEGLDAEQQQFYFEGQLRIAQEFDLPVIVHARRAVDAVIAAIRKVDGLRGVIHSFPGSPEQAAQLHKLGFLVGLGGPLTYDRAQRLHRLVAQLPLEQLLLETDAPDQPDAGIRGERNEPARLAVILETVAKIRSQPEQRIAEQTTANARRLFSLP